LKLVSYNIQYGFGSDGRYDLARVAKALQGADIIALQEVERHWSRTNFDDQPARLADLLPGYYTAYGPAFDMDASTVSGGIVANRRRQFGTMLLSRFPIQWTRLHTLPMRRMIDPLNTRNAALEGMILTPAGPLRILSLHLAHVGVAERLQQIDYLLAQHASAAAEGGPWSGRDDEPGRNWTEGEREPPCPMAAIWLGDFNSEPASAEYRRITGETPYHSGARYHAGFCDAAVVAGPRTTPLYTHEKVIDGATRLRQLDHCFLSPILAPRLRSVVARNDEIASDHHPLWIEIDLESPLTE
jgi:endonuclease/exonuclease/phosphatase family metal-dependent hydrolase